MIEKPYNFIRIVLALLLISIIWIDLSHAQLSVAVRVTSWEARRDRDRDDDGYVTAVKCTFELFTIGTPSAGNSVYVKKVATYYQRNPPVWIPGMVINVEKSITHGEPQTYYAVFGDLSNARYNFKFVPYFGLSGNEQGQSFISNGIALETRKQDKPRKNNQRQRSERMLQSQEFDNKVVKQHNQNHKTFLDWCLDENISRDAKLTLSLFTSKYRKKLRGEDDCYRMHLVIDRYLRIDKGYRCTIRKGYGTGKKPNRIYHPPVYGESRLLMLNRFGVIVDLRPLQILDQYPNIKAVSITVPNNVEKVCPCERVKCIFVGEDRKFNYEDCYPVNPQRGRPSPSIN